MAQEPIIMPIIGYDGKYEIHLTGTPDGQPGIWRCDKGRYKTQSINTSTGRKFIWLSKNNIGNCITVHQLLAEHFIIPPDDKYRTVDHINGDYKDNRIQNLRWLTPAEQEINKPGNLGYSWSSDHNKYRARIKVNGKEIHLGYFDHPYKAHLAYKAACELYYPGIRTCLREEIDG